MDGSSHPVILSLLPFVLSSQKLIICSRRFFFVCSPVLALSVLMFFITFFPFLLRARSHSVYIYTSFSPPHSPVLSHMRSFLNLVHVSSLSKLAYLLHTLSLSCKRPYLQYVCLFVLRFYLCCQEDKRES
jgi:hypothetical protein